MKIDAIISPTISVGAAKTEEKSPIPHAVSTPANKPQSIATPPRDGVGSKWTFLSSGSTSNPALTEIR
jgi:hypothetical protein